MVVGVLDFEKICRTCMKNNGKLRSIFDLNKKQTVKLSVMITECVSMKVIEDDGLPSKICTKCVYKLNNVYRFRKKCQDVDLKLRSYSNKAKERRTSTSSDRADVSDAETNGDCGSFVDDVEPEPVDGSNPDFDVKPKTRRQKGNANISSAAGPARGFSNTERKSIEGNGDDDRNIGSSETENQTISVEVRKDSKYSEEDVDGSIETRIGSDVGKAGGDKTAIEKRPSDGNKKRHQCETCGKFLSCRSNLLQHMRRHTGEKPFPCDLCGKTFGRAEHMAIHRRTHTGERPHVCKVCGKAFVQHAALASHVRTHTGERPHVCSACGKSFAQAVTLTYHVRTHTGETPFRCALCGKGFAHSGNLNIHMRFHSGERPFCCSTCGRRFVTSSHLAVHTKQHDGIRDHACAVCGKAFVRREHLRDHAVIHTGAKPHACKLCPKRYTQSSHLSRHMKTHVKKETEAVFLKTEAVD